MAHLEALEAEFQNADKIIEAHRQTGFPLHFLCGVLSVESLGRNIYGGDIGGVFSSYPGGGRIEVTEENFKEFRKRVLDGEKSNGVGPMQITWHELFNEAEKLGYSLWLPLDNLLYGILLYKRFMENTYSYDALAKGATIYNSGPYKGKINEYARKVVAKAKEWEIILAGAEVVNNTSEVPEGLIKHIIVKDDTLWKLSMLYRTTIDKLIEINHGVDPLNLKVGNTLLVPIKTHTVVKNDTLWGISRTYGTSVSKLQELNSMGDSTILKVGQILRVI